MKQLAELIWIEESGATMVEYGLMLAAIAVVVVGAAFAFGVRVDTMLFQLGIDAFN